MFPVKTSQKLVFCVYLVQKMKSPPPGLSFRPTGQNTLGGGRICHIVTLICFFVPFLQIHFIVLMYEIKIGCNEKTSPKTLSGMLGEIFLNLNVEYFNLHMLRHGVPCSPNSKTRSIGTYMLQYGSEMQNEFVVRHSLLSRHTVPTRTVAYSRIVAYLI